MRKGTEVTIIVVGGVIGGLISVLDAWAGPVPYPLTFSTLASLVLIPGVKGGVAAGIGVYLLTQLDSTQLVRAFFFAVTCGLTFPSILARGSSLADQATSQVAGKTIAANAQRVQSTTPSGQTQLSTAAVSEITDASIAILHATPRADESDAKFGESVVQQAVSSLGSNARESGDAGAVKALESIGTVAASQESRGPLDASLSALKTIKDAPNLREDVRTGAANAIERIHGAGPLGVPASTDR
jgi:hypothetical protein